MSMANHAVAANPTARAGREAGRGTARLHLHLDGVALLAGAVLAYALAGGSWWLFLALLLAPDLFMLGYLGGPRVGAAVYNAGHSLLWPAVLIGTAVLSGGAEAIEPAAGAARAGGPSVLLSVGIIWAAHIGMDRAFGFGYKYPTAFSDTDIGRA
jgi:hypothetical protein